MIIGIDIGSTTTKAVSIKDGKLANKIKTKAQDAVTAATGAFGKIVSENNIKIDKVKKIYITGAGSSKIKNDIFGIPTTRVNEIDAIGIGGMYLSKMNNIIITNIGTGTVIIEASSLEDGSRKIVHFGGSGVGGGTILGLAKRLLQKSEFADIMELAKTGKLNNVDLLLGDITDTSISFLNPENTASNFAKMLDSAAPSDIALAIINLVYQVIGVLSVFAARASSHGSLNASHKCGAHSGDTKRVVITGNGSKNPIGQKILKDISVMYGIEFIYPEYPEYTTAIGAGLSAN